MGRTRTPAGVMTARGNPGRRPIAATAASGPADSGAGAPDWLAAEAREIWARLAPDLRQNNLIKALDELTFARYCENFALWLQARAALAAGTLVKTTTSEHVTMERLDKNLQAMLLLEKRLVDLEDRFGLNPGARQRIFAQRAAGAGASTLPGELPLDQGPAPSPAVGFLQ
jgi:P27 family predicted phage terminase small subunit